MPEARPFAPLHHLQRMLGLPTWRLRRDIAASAIPVVAADAPGEESVAQTVREAAAGPSAVAASAAGKAEALPVLFEVDGHEIRICRDLTLLGIRGSGTWWLPALSQADGRMRLFRSDAEMLMLRTMLTSVGLTALAGHMAHIDAFLAARQMPANRPPADAADLLSLPAPWLLCGAIAQKQAESVTAAQERLPLPHPLALLKAPQQKRAAWQQLLAYKQKIHD